MASVGSVGALISVGSLYAPAAHVAVSAITQSLDHVKIRFTSEIVSGISNALQKLLSYFSWTVISTSFLLPYAADFPMMPVLYLKYSVRLKILKILNHIIHQHYNI